MDYFRQSAWARGWEDTELSWPREIAVGLLAAALTFVFLPRDQALSAVLASLIAISSMVLLWLIEFLYNCLRAPVRQRNEAREQVENTVRLREEIVKLRERMAGVEADRAELLAQLEKDCPVWHHEPSGSIIIGKGDSDISVQGGTFPYRLVPNGSRIEIKDVRARSVG